MSEKLMDIAESTAQGSFNLFLGNTLSALILAMGSVFIIRLLGPKDYGLYSLSLVMATLLVQLSSLGIDQTFMRFSANLRAEGKETLLARILKSGFAFILLMGVVASMIGFVFSDVFATYVLKRPEVGVFVKLASFTIPFQIAYVVTNSTFIGLDRTEKTALTMNVQSIVKTALSPLFILMGFSVIGAIMGHISSYLVASLIGILLLRGTYQTLKEISNNENGASLENIKLILSYGFPLYLSTFLGTVLNQYQFILLAYYASNFEIGNFSAALNFIVLINLLLFPLATVLLPGFSKLNPQGEAPLIRRFFWLSAKYVSLLIVPASVVIMTLSKDIVYTIYGSSYELAPIFLSLYTVIFLYVGLGSITLGNYLNGIGETKLTLKIGFANAFIFAPLAPLLTHLYGIPGLITAFLSSNFISLLWGLAIAKKRFNVAPNLSDSLKIYLTSFLSAIPTFTLLRLFSFNSPLNLIFGSFLYISVYLTLLPFLGGIYISDIENIRFVYSKLKLVQPFLKPVLAYEAMLLKVKYPN